MAADLGYAGISQKYFLVSLTAYQSELKKLSWQIEGSGKQHINTSMKSAVLAVGSKLMDGIAQIKEWRDVEKVRHRELLAAVSAVEIACTKLTSQGSGPVAAPNMGAPAPSTFGAHPPESPRPVRQHKWEQCQQLRCQPHHHQLHCGFSCRGSTCVPSPGKAGLASTCPNGIGDTDPSGVSRRHSPRRSGKQCLVLRTQFGNNRN